MNWISSPLLKRVLLTAWAFAFCHPLHAQTPAPTPMTIGEADGKIRIDGHLEDWPPARMFHLYQKNQVTSGAPFWKDDDSFSGRIFLTYDAQFLYLSAVVTKVNPVVNEGSKLSLLNGDCVELLLSTGQNSARRNRLSRGDYHLGFSPGTDCKYPSLYCFNLDREITGARVVARKDPRGYVLEAAVPLSFLEGLDLGQGQKALVDVVLDEGGSLSGNRIVRMDYALDDFSASHPGRWAEIQWTGTDKASIPFSESGDLNSDLVADGTAGDTFRGLRPVKGWVLDEKGKPLSDATVSTWPRTQEIKTAADGSFAFDAVKIYDRTLLYAREDGFLTSLSPYTQSAPITVRLKPLPEELIPESGEVSPSFFGLNVKVPAGGMAAPPADPTDAVSKLSLKFLDLSGLDPNSQTLREMEKTIGVFTAYCSRLGCTPLVRLPLPFTSADTAAALVSGAKGMEYWALGDEPDRLEGINDDPAQSPFNVYRYINEFRADYNAMKLVNPGIVILGPELSEKYTHAENDWLTPFLRYDGDIVNLVSIHRYAVADISKADDKAVMKALRDEPALIRGLEDKVDVNTDVTVPLVVTGGNVFPASATIQTLITPTPASSAPATATLTPTPVVYPTAIWPALWAAEETGLLLSAGIPMENLSALSGQGSLDAMVSGAPQPLYWVLEMLAPYLKGKVLSAQTHLSDLYVFAIEEEDRKTVHLILVNTGNRYVHPRISFNGADDDVSVVSDLSLEADLEVPEMGLARLTLRADGKPGESEVYFYKSALSGSAPILNKVHP